ncbi:unnamed protein product [Phaeothamnion confervicola]
MRTLALSYGADTVWGEEIIDRAIVKTRRHVNLMLGTVDYVNANGRSAVFQTCPAEHGRMVFQIGTSNAVTALAAAQYVERDVAAIDINMASGCPKRFSTQDGMGAALMVAPESAADIVATLRRNLAVPVTAKMRLLASEHDVR